MTNTAGVRAVGKTTGKVTCRDCSFVRFKRAQDASKTFTDAARWHAGHYDHTVTFERTTTTVFSMSDTINEVIDGHNKEEDLPSNPRGSERDDVAPVGGIRQDAEVVRGWIEREGARVSTEAQRAYEANMRGALSVSGSFVESLARHPNNKGKS